MPLTERQAAIAIQAVQTQHAASAIIEGRLLGSGMERVRFEAADIWENMRKEQAEVTFLVACPHRRGEEIIVKDTNVQIDTQQREQDGVRVLAEAACELRRRLDLEERRTRRDLVPCRAEPEVEVKTETREYAEASGKGPAEVYTYALKLFTLLMCLIYWCWRNPVPTLVR